MILCHLFATYVTPFVSHNHLKHKDYLVFQAGTPISDNFQMQWPENCINCPDGYRIEPQPSPAVVY